MHTQVEVHDNVLLLDVFSIKIFAKVDLTLRTLLPLFLVTGNPILTMGCSVS